MNHLVYTERNGTEFVLMFNYSHIDGAYRIDNFNTKINSSFLMSKIEER